MTGVRIPNSVTKLGRNAFYGCGSLEEFVLGKGITSITDTVFSSESVDRLLLTESITEVGGQVFNTCNRLCNFVVMNPQCLLSEDAFVNCEPSVGQTTLIGHRGSTAEDYINGANEGVDPELHAPYQFIPLCDCTDGSSSYTVSYPDCDEGGDVIYYCNICRNTKVVESIQAYGHELSFVEKIPATCTEDGEWVEVCLWCVAPVCGSVA